MNAKVIAVAFVDRATVAVIADLVVIVAIAALAEEVLDVQSARTTVHAAIVAANVERDDQVVAVCGHTGLKLTFAVPLVCTGTGADAVDEQILRRTATGVRYVGDHILRRVIAIREEVDHATIALR